jgi:serine protease Do
MFRSHNDAARALQGAGAAFVFAILAGVATLAAPVRAYAATPVAETPADLAAAERAFETGCQRAWRSVVTVVGVRSHESLRAAEGGSVRAARSLASGTVVDARGHVVTAASAVADCDRIEVRLADGRIVTAILLGTDDASDVALLKLPLHDVPALAWAPDSAAAIGAWVAVMGQTSQDQPRKSLGTVRRRYDQPLSSLLLLTNPVYPGFSGGPALNAKGEMVGLVIGPIAEAPADWSEGEGARPGASFALAGDDLRAVVAQLERYGRVRRGFLGVRMVQGEIVDSNHPDDPFKIGVRVEDVLPGSPAAQAGLKPGDLIVGWNGETLQSPEDLMRRVEGSPPGTRAALVWVRNDGRFDGSLVVGAKPDDELLASPGGPPGGGSTMPSDPARPNELLERVKSLRGRTPGAAPDSAVRTIPG